MPPLGEEGTILPSGGRARTRSSPAVRTIRDMTAAAPIGNLRRSVVGPESVGRGRGNPLGIFARRSFPVSFGGGEDASFGRPHDSREGAGGSISTFGNDGRDAANRCGILVRPRERRWTYLCRSMPVRLRSYLSAVMGREIILARNLTALAPV